MRVGENRTIVVGATVSDRMEPVTACCLCGSEQLVPLIEVGQWRIVECRRCELAMLAFSFPAEGKYPDIKRFIYEVETSDRLVGVQDLKLESDTGRVKMNVKLMTYVKGR